MRWDMSSAHLLIGLFDRVLIKRPNYLQEIIFQLNSYSVRFDPNPSASKLTSSPSNSVFQIAMQLVGLERQPMSRTSREKGVNIRLKLW
ncbi:hypothetical protein CEXT_599901 [Caerostris extrusa]|uniref:Maturase K n=1 Tax=Caerostris extrusa TaxID=172846 RepID=A0AAV4XQJ9_CAEEX|nr:hypothetical protein CEXT_599901 [Caerostris extrusa]